MSPILANIIIQCLNEYRIISILISIESLDLRQLVILVFESFGLLLLIIVENNDSIQRHPEAKKIVLRTYTTKLITYYLVYLLFMFTQKSIFLNVCYFFVDLVLKVIIVIYRSYLFVEERIYKREEALLEELQTKNFYLSKKRYCQVMQNLSKIEISDEKAKINFVREIFSSLKYYFSTYNFKKTSQILTDKINCPYVIVINPIEDDFILDFSKKDVWNYIDIDKSVSSSISVANPHVINQDSNELKSEDIEKKINNNNLFNSIEKNIVFSFSLGKLILIDSSLKRKYE